jgi:hypothetical protein
MLAIFIEALSGHDADENGPPETASPAVLFL